MLKAIMEDLIMVELMWLYGALVMIMLFIVIWLLNFWAKEHALLMSIMSHTLVEIKKKINS